MSRARATSLLALGVALVLTGVVAFAQDLPARCTGLCRADRQGHFVAMEDLVRPSSPLDGDDLLALVNRSPVGALPPEYEPGDLLDLETMRPSRPWQCVPPRRQCLRRQAAEAYRRLARAMREARLRPVVSSAFRAYRVQCSTFLNWTQRDSFCEAATASALPGHSQHQLGTTLDLFTNDWTLAGNKFREGFGCSPGGLWIAEHAHEYGFVLPYPLHPDYRRPGSACAATRGAEERLDPRTGYRYEPWHLRYVGEENATQYREAWTASAPGTESEITLEQWLRSRRGIPRPVGAPVCDGCNCDRCATFGEGGPCETPAWLLGPSGNPAPPTRAPRVLGVVMRRDGERLLLEARIDVAQNTATQPPFVTSASEAVYRRGARPVNLPGGASRAYEPLDGAYRLAVGFDARDDWPWAAALVQPDRDGSANGFNALVPAAPGEITVVVPMERVAPSTLVRVGIAHGGRVGQVAFRGPAP